MESFSFEQRENGDLNSKDLVAEKLVRKMVIPVIHCQNVSVRLSGHGQGCGDDRGGARCKDCDGHSEEDGRASCDAAEKQGNAQVDQGQKPRRQVSWN